MTDLPKFVLLAAIAAAPASASTLTLTRTALAMNLVVGDNAQTYGTVKPYPADVVVNGAQAAELRDTDTGSFIEVDLLTGEMRHYLRTPADVSDGMTASAGAYFVLNFTYSGETQSFAPGAFGFRSDGLFQPDIALQPSEDGQRQVAQARANATVQTEMNTSSRDTAKVGALATNTAHYFLGDGQDPRMQGGGFSDDDGLDGNFGPGSYIDLGGYDVSFGTPAYTLSDGDTLGIYARISGSVLFNRCRDTAYCPVGEVVLDATSTTRFGLTLPDGVTAVDGLTGKTLNWTAAAMTTPVPLPAAAWMLLAGLGALGIASRKQRG